MPPLARVPAGGSARSWATGTVTVRWSCAPSSRPSRDIPFLCHVNEDAGAFNHGFPERKPCKKRTMDCGWISTIPSCAYTWCPATE